MGMPFFSHDRLCRLVAGSRHGRRRFSKRLFRSALIASNTPPIAAKGFSGVLASSAACSVMKVDKASSNTCSVSAAGLRIRRGRNYVGIFGLSALQMLDPLVHRMIFDARQIWIPLRAVTIGNDCPHARTVLTLPANVPAIPDLPISDDQPRFKWKIFQQPLKQHRSLIRRGHDGASTSFGDFAPAGLASITSIHSPFGKGRLASCAKFFPKPEVIRTGSKKEQETMPA